MVRPELLIRSADRSPVRASRTIRKDKTNHHTAALSRQRSQRSGHLTGDVSILISRLLARHWPCIRPAMRPLVRLPASWRHSNFLCRKVSKVPARQQYSYRSVQQTRTVLLSRYGTRELKTSAFLNSSHPTVPAASTAPAQLSCGYNLMPNSLIEPSLLRIHHYGRYCSS